jgi:GT2 family glycosyltransferase
MAPRTAGLILTYNGERLLERCLAALDFCDTLAVVDSVSTDATVDIARAAGAMVFFRKWEGPDPQFRFALEHLRAMAPKGDWAVSLDQDECLTDALNASIRAAIAALGKAAGFMPLRGLARFLKICVLKSGVLDGRAGFANAVHGAVYAFIKHVRVAEQGDWGAKA